VASQFGPERLEYTTGGAIASQPIFVRLRGSLALAELFSDASEEAGAENPVLTDPDGNLVFFAAAGYYDLVFGGYEVPIIVGTPAGGAAANSYTHIQSVAASQWVINHGLPFRPAGVQVIETGGDPGIAAVDYAGDLVLLDFAQPTTGVAYLS
jgi:hypothetical protein